MGPHTITTVVPDDVTPDPVAAPTTSYLARTTTYADVLARYRAILSGLSVSQDVARAATG
ncbi:MAG TPA: hypothetical protein VNC61_15620 [Acidimicrobiales bacterium]|nr:hypothetical protein [Acidimicrobiales bacterium]